MSGWIGIRQVVGEAGDGGKADRPQMGSNGREKVENSLLIFS